MRNGYSDPTANIAIANIIREQHKKEREEERRKRETERKAAAQRRKAA